ncbi:tannase and feruloyl esterase [Dendrothele bispora CBS 962.96]|uniref:Carboxylic ester hydrolase n=1 Tax=Dendrothele bispora (strain CBS 962.96) TaxID=1314807 RepID=A0A4S8MI96_DENBC|nr:tannase and feruloyl esterase [Dendrothele bispora CBS 962.96]
MVARFWSVLTTLTLFLGLSTSTSHTQSQGQSHSTKFNFDSACSSISSRLSVPNATNISSTLIQANTNLTFPNTDPSCNRPFQIVLTDTCRITMSIATSSAGKSGIEFEAWFPRNWTGRFLSTGNGGLSGCIQYEDLAYTAALGFAAVGANNGHNGTSGAPFLNNPDVLEDFVYRSIHTGVLIGKNLTSTFYGHPHSKSYYLGSLKTIQDFPSDFGGVVAGAPAADFNHLLDWSGHFLELTGSNDSSAFLTTEKWVNLVHPDVLRQCDGIDGVRDGIIEDPGLCEYDPSGLVQADMIKEVYKPFFINGELAYPRLQPGSEDLPVFFTGEQFIFTADWFRYVVYSDPSYDVSTLSEKDWALAEDLDPFNISTWKADLSAFRNRQGKLLTYHGQTDNLISPLNSERYYDRVAKTMGLTSNQEQDEFYRFFRISGMGHCSGGVGAWEIGQTLAGSGNLSNLDPESNVLTAMVRWVEEGVAPESVLGRKYVNDDVDEGVAFSRRHCKYPLRNTYDGVGDSTKPESWKCL